MILFTDRLKTVFLNRAWVGKLKEIGMDFSDTEYYIVEMGGADYICGKDELPLVTSVEIVEGAIGNLEPTYSLGDILCKLDEYPYLNDDGGEEMSGPLEFCKDAPFYMFAYYLKGNDGKTRKSIEAPLELPLYSAASLLISAYKEGIGYNRTDISDIAERTKAYEK